jgi:N-acyl-D-aspartate/D-glutamate deacylase
MPTRWLLLFAAARLAAQPYDLAVNQVRVIDPETLTSQVRSVGVRSGKIAAISAAPLEAARVISGRGLALAPGFIDLHAHGQDEENQRLQVRDGVTTALELEIGAADVSAWYAAREGRRFIHSGVSAGHVPLRMKLMRDPSPSLVPSGPAKDRAAGDEEITQIRAGVERGLREGALGLGFGIQYTPGASRWEILETFRAGARFRAPAFVHIRTMGAPEGGSRDAMTGLQEIIAASAVTGMPVHMVHVTSSGLRQAPQLIQTVLEAKARGMDISTECYPYNAAMTDLASAIFDPGWEKILGIGYGDLQWVATGERLTAETFARLRPRGGMVIMHMIPEPAILACLSEPAVIVASDGHIENGKGHPRGAGTFARTLGYWVRERRVLTLEQAIRKMTLLPAQRLEKFVPAMADKGRIRVGADADLVVFDPEAVRDQATFDQPNLPSAGFRYVIVGGTPVVDEGRLREDVRPGKAIRAPQR